MPTTNFSALSLLWPFANELDQTLFVYNDPKERASLRPHIPPNDGIAKFTLSTALGHIAMDNSTPSFHLVGQRDKEYREKKKRKQLIYIGGEIGNEAVRDFFNSCDHKEMERVITLPSNGGDLPRAMKIKGQKDLLTEYYDSKHEYPKIDYGLILLTTNSFATKNSLKTLLLAGMHSYGTLAAARAVSDSHLSVEITRPIMTNFHVPPHLFGVNP